MCDTFVVALAVFIGVARYEMFGMSILSRPTVVVPLAGALMGDLQTGLIVGASLEVIFMGVANIGISSTAEPSLVAGLAIALAIRMGGNVDAITLTVFPLAVLGLQLMNMISPFVCGPMAVKFFKFTKSGDQKGIINLYLFMWSVHYVLYALIPFFVVLSGVDVVKSVLDNIPEVTMNGLAAAGSLLPAVGTAVLLRMSWSKSITVWFFFGAAVMTYLELPLIAIVAVGTITATAIAQRGL